MTPEFHPAAQEELAAAVKTGDMRAAGLGLELLRETQRVVALLGSAQVTSNYAMQRSVFVVTPLAGTASPRDAGLRVTATCHCGAVRVHVPRAPRTLTKCNCSVCRRYGALWAYFSARTVQIEAPPGALSMYSWRRKVRLYFRCKRCGCVTHYKYRKKGRSYPVAVNATNFEPAVLQGARIRRLDGAATWTWKYERQSYTPS